MVKNANSNAQESTKKYIGLNCFKDISDSLKNNNRGQQNILQGQSKNAQYISNQITKN